MATKEEILDSISQMTVLELSELLKEFEERFDVTAAAPAAAVVAAPAADAGGDDEDVKDSFDVVLAGVGDKKIQVIKEVRSLTSLGLKEAKDLVDNAPKPVLEGLPKEDAEKAKVALEAVGAEVQRGPTGLTAHRGRGRTQTRRLGAGRGRSMERRLELDGPSNFRDLGGVPVAGGGSIRTGLVFRADRLGTLTDADLRRLEAANIRHVFDLRSEAEAAEFPDRLPAGASYVRMPMTSDETFRARTIFERIAEREIKSYGEAEMVAGYVRILENFGPAFVRIARQVGVGDPVVIHCTAGKDRTGVASMMLLDLAGVAAEHVAADYALSSQRRPSLQRDHTEARSLQPMLEDLGLDPAGFAPLWEARPAVILATLQELHDQWGGAAGYLSAAGMDDAEIDTVRAQLRAA